MEAGDLRHRYGESPFWLELGGLHIDRTGLVRRPTRAAMIHATTVHGLTPKRRTMAGVPVPRETSRVIVLDPAGRVLLLGYVLPARRRTVWVTPGGGAGAARGRGSRGPARACQRDRHDHQPRQALPSRRHLRGVLDVSRRRGIRRARHVLRHPSRRVRAHDLGIYSVRAGAGEARVRWWTPDELETTDDIVFPAGLAMLIRRLGGGDYPVRLGDADPTGLATLEDDLGSGAVKYVHAAEWSPEVIAAYELAHLGFYTASRLELQHHARRLNQEFWRDRCRRAA